MISFKKREKKGSTIKIAEDHQLNGIQNIHEEEQETNDSVDTKDFLNKKRQHNFSVKFLLI